MKKRCSSFQLSQETAVVLSSPYTFRISKGDAFADVAAKAAACQPVAKITTVVSDEGSSPSLRKLYQSAVKNEEKQEWRKW